MRYYPTAKRIHRSAWKWNSREFTCSILHISVYEDRAAWLSADFMDRSQHYILWCWMIMQQRA